MSLDGIWTGEVLGPYGWENTGVYVLERNRIIGGNNRHYSTGKFKLSNDTYTATIAVHYYGPPRAIFGQQQENFQIEVTGKLKDDVIDARIVRLDAPHTDVHYRMTRRICIPKD